MAGRILDSDEINRLSKLGWTTPEISRHFHVPWQSIHHSLQEDRKWASNPEELRARWAAKMPAIRAAFLADIKDFSGQ